MKRILILLGLMAATSLGMQAENRTVTDTVDGKKRVIELQDTVINGQQTTDTLSITTYEGTDSSEADSDGTYRHRHDSSGLQWVGFNFGEDAPETIVALTAIIFVFGLPALLLFIIFYFRYKNRKAKYRLAVSPGRTGTGCRTAASTRILQRNQGRRKQRPAQPRHQEYLPGHRALHLSVGSYR